ncbi:MAG: hypothetical protein WA376_17960, partial [Terrimicrobiaceae bacterium]
ASFVAAFTIEANVGGSMAIRDRAAGTVMGALIGDALAVGPHWGNLKSGSYYSTERKKCP